MPIKILSPQDAASGAPDVSVVIPTFERPEMLKEALRSVHAQSYDGSAEILVVNDSPRGKLGPVIAHDFPLVHVVAEGTGCGATGARNRALAVAKGKYIAFLDDDDLWEPDYLKIQLAALRGRENTFAVSGLAIWNMKSGEKRSSVQVPDLKRYRSVAHQLIVANFIRCPSSVVVPREAIDKAGSFDEQCPIGEDYDFYLRCLIAGFHPVFTRAPIVVRRQHNAQMTGPSNLDKRNAARVARVRKFYPLIQRSFAIDPLRSVYAEVYAKFAVRYFRNRRYWKSAGSFLVSLTQGSPRYTFRRFPQSWRTKWPS